MSIIGLKLQRDDAEDWNNLRTKFEYSRCELDSSDKICISTKCIGNSGGVNALKKEELHAYEKDKSVIILTDKD